ncbi:hypothetical protein Bca4012_072332 [Brassica carinata]
MLKPRDKNGMLHVSAFEGCVISPSVECSACHLISHVVLYDCRHYKQLTYRVPEVVALVWPKLLSEAKTTAPYTEEQLLRLFRIFNTDGDGFITAADLAHSMSWPCLDSGGVGGMINEADSDGDSQIHCQVFSEAIHSAAFDDL